MNETEEKLDAAEKEEARERSTPLTELEIPVKQNQRTRRLYANWKPEGSHVDGSIHHAHALYLNYTTIEDIARITSADRDIIRYFVYKPDGWKVQREKIEEELAEEVKKTSIDQLRKINVTCLCIIEKAVVDFREAKIASGEEITLNEAKAVTNIWTKIHGGKLLEEMGATGISTLSKTPQDVLRAFKNDPFLGEALQAIDVTPSKTDEQLEVERGPAPAEEPAPHEGGYVEHS